MTGHENGPHLFSGRPHEVQVEDLVGRLDGVVSRVHLQWPVVVVEVVTDW